MFILICHLRFYLLFMAHSDISWSKTSLILELSHNNYSYLKKKKFKSLCTTREYNNESNITSMLE